MEKISSFNAKTHLSDLLARVSDGERFIITRHNIDIAMLSPVNLKVEDVESAIESIKRSRKGRKIGVGNIKEFIEEGRR